MKTITNSFYIVLISILGMYCNNAKPVKNEITQVVKTIKVTATKDDLCRILVEQEVFIDTSIGRDKKTIVMALLSDGTGVEEIVDRDTLMETYSNAGFPTNYYMVPDSDIIIHNVKFAGVSYKHGNILENIILYNVNSQKRDSLFCEDSNYVAEGYDMAINDFKINPKGDYLIISTTDFIRCVNLKSGTWYDINGKVPFELLWKNKDSFYYNKRYNKKRECRLYDISTKKSTTIFPDDTLPLQNTSVTLDGDHILKYIDINSETDTDTSGKIGDSLCFFDSDFKPVSGSFIFNSQYTQYKIAPSGKWIYYTDDRALRRVKIEDVEGISQSIDDLHAKSQVVYPFPIMTNGNDITETAYGLITQILPVENGGK